MHEHLLPHLLPLLRGSLDRLERLDPAGGASPFDELELARALSAHAACLEAAAAALEARAHEALGRYGAQAVERAARAAGTADAEWAATEVAEAFLALTRSGRSPSP